MNDLRIPDQTYITLKLSDVIRFGYDILFLYLCFKLYAFLFFFNSVGLIIIGRVSFIHYPDFLLLFSLVFGIQHRKGPGVSSTFSHIYYIFFLHLDLLA